MLISFSQQQPYQDTWITRQQGCLTFRDGAGPKSRGFPGPLSSLVAQSLRPLIEGAEDESRPSNMFGGQLF